MWSCHNLVTYPRHVNSKPSYICARVSVKRTSNRDKLMNPISTICHADLSVRHLSCRLVRARALSIMSSTRPCHLFCQLVRAPSYPISCCEPSVMLDPMPCTICDTDLFDNKYSFFRTSVIIYFQAIQISYDHTMLPAPSRAIHSPFSCPHHCVSSTRHFHVCAITCHSLGIIFIPTPWAILFAGIFMTTPSHGNLLADIFVPAPSHTILLVSSCPRHLAPPTSHC